MREVSPWLRQSGKRADGASIVSEVLVRYIGSRGRRIVRLLAALGLLLAGCTSGGDSGQPSAPSAPSPMVERQAIDNLLTLYQEALVAEDSDRLQALLAPAAALGQAQTTTAPRQDSTGTFTDLAAFQDALRATFQQSTVTALAIPPETVVVAPDQGSVTFLEVESILDQRTLAQHTRVYRTTWQLRRTPTGARPSLALQWCSGKALWCRSPPPARCRRAR